MELDEPKMVNSITYVGSSMSPTLVAGDLLQIVPYADKNVQPGDVIVFVSPVDGSRVAHRAVLVDSNGIKTRGDNCNQVDQWVLDRKQVLGRVTHAQRRDRRRRIFGGLLGRLFAAKVRVIHAVDSGFSSLLHPVYKRLSRSDIFRRWLPSGMRPRVISFNRDAGTELQLVMGRRVIGKWREGRSGWNIQRPFRLFVDEESLPENAGKWSVVR